MARKRTLFYHSIQSFLKKLSKYRAKISKKLRLFLILLFSLLVASYITPVFSQSNPIEKLKQESQAYYEQGDLFKAAQKLEELIQQFNPKTEVENLAIAWTNLGKIQSTIGNTEEALNSWQIASQFYQQIQKKDALLPLQIYQAIAWQKLGQYSQGCQTLTQALNLNQSICQTEEIKQETIDEKINTNSSPTYLEGWQSLADNLRLIGRLKESQLILEKLTLINSNLAPTQLSLGNTLRARGNLERDRQAELKYDYLPWRYEKPFLSEDILTNFYEPALRAYHKASQSQSIITKINAQLNQLNLLIEVGRWQEAEDLLTQINLQKLPMSKTKIFAEINYAKSLNYLRQSEKVSPENNSNLEKILQQTLREAETLNQQSKALNVSEDTDSILSHVLGNIGGFYEYLYWKSPQEKTELEKAVQFTQQALYLAQLKPHLAYQWQWQLGRLLEKQEKTEEAIITYESAIKNLDSVRDNLLTINTDVQFSFRDNVEPLYRQAISLLVSEQPSNINQEKLIKSIYYLEALHLAELENYFQCNLLETQPIKQEDKAENLIQKLEQIFSQDDSAALVYPIILKDQIIVIFKLPSLPFRYSTYQISNQEVATTLNQLQNSFKDPSRTNAIKKLSNQVYNWIIQPLEKELETEIERENSKIKTLVFVLDTYLRNIPMTILYNSQKEQYLLERYSIALVPSLQLLKPAKKIDKFQTLLAGISQERQIGEQTYSSLPNVPEELNNIQSIVPSLKLLNETFTKSLLEKNLDSGVFPFVHFATHGQFSSNPEETFIILYDDQLKQENLTQLFTQNQNLELLILSACETATGDKRAVLGLAGVAIRAEALSTLATLWQVDDESTATLMSLFYRQLINNPQISKADALRQAQLELWQNKQQDWQMPYFWAPYILVGNWI